MEQTKFKRSSFVSTVKKDKFYRKRKLSIANVSYRCILYTIFSTRKQTNVSPNKKSLKINQ